MSEIIVDVPSEGVTRITLSRPQALNAFTFDMYARLIEILRSLERDSKTRVVVLTGAGKGFCECLSTSWPEDAGSLYSDAGGQWCGEDTCEVLWPVSSGDAGAR